MSASDSQIIFRPMQRTEWRKQRAIGRPNENLPRSYRSLMTGYGGGARVRRIDEPSRHDGFGTVSALANKDEANHESDRFLHLRGGRLSAVSGGLCVDGAVRWESLDFPHH